ncbi:MAG: bifunctional 5,10-methylene-tetrahydrofolate dehydrogenase/5,10-methylene-tetrahydrofolate cyclohydrolase [Proteobacteria bacterium]|nr:bifunctional 5,10-methylene-tetrahydrofolate dehydrogenase/5,10-methylene-tetrahydrofolate cyclohydrolase [Pseudomonadota bacterium]
MKPSLAVVLVGDDPASAIYVRNKKRTCDELGIRSVEKKMSQETSQAELMQVVRELNDDPSVNGVLCQVPLPSQCDEHEIIRTIVGRPLSILMSLKECNATVTVCHSRTKDLPQVCRSADILVVAIGRARFVTAEFVKKGGVVIDVGMNRIEDPTHSKGSRLVGDVDFEGIREVAATPVPGGVGPMTIAMLMYNTINAARFQVGMERFEL